MAVSLPAVEAHPAARPARAIAAIAALWLLSAYLLAFPLLSPRGLYLAGRYRLLDIYLGLPLFAISLAALLVQLFPRSSRRLLAMRLVLIFTSTLLTTASIDWAVVVWRAVKWDFWFDHVHVTRSGNRPDSELGWVRLSHLEWKGRERRETHEIVYRTDDNGFRNPSGPRRADAVFIGDSFTEANEVRDSETFASLTGAQTGMSIANLGRSGYGPPQELIVLRRFGLQYTPRVVVWQLFEGNDLRDAENFVVWNRGPSAWGDDVRPRHPFTLYATYSILRRVLENTARYEEHARLRDGAQERPLKLMPDDVYESNARLLRPSGYTETRRSVGEFARICKQSGARLIVVLVPTRPHALRTRIRFLKPAYAEMYLRGGHDHTADDLDALLADECARTGCQYLNLLTALRNADAAGARDLYFPGDVHLDIGGHRLVADEVAALIGRGVRK